MQSEIDRVVSFLRGCRPDEWLDLAGLGLLTCKVYEPYLGRNPRTGASVAVPGKRLPFFRVDSELRCAINGVPSLDAADDSDTDEEGLTVTRTSWATELGAYVRGKLLAGESVELAGLGTFACVEKAARPGFNPQTGERIVIPARRVVSFSASLVLKERLAERP